MNAPTKKSKKQDQLWIAKAELSSKELRALVQAARAARLVFAWIMRTHKAFAGTRTINRLARTARRAKKTPLAYTLSVLLK